MKAMRVNRPGGLDRLELVDLNAPDEPGPGQIRVRLHASSLNYHDYAVITGRIPVAEGRIPMSDGAGVITQIGAGVRGFSVGDRVVSAFFPEWFDGLPAHSTTRLIPGDSIDGYAVEEVVVDQRAFVAAPANYTHAEAATLTCAGLTAWRALVVEGRIKPGDIVLVQGTGGVSIFALQFAKMAGAAVIATSSSDAKLEQLRLLGADHLINYRTIPDWGLAARKLSGRGGVDHVVEIGGAGTLARSVQATRNGGHIALIGVLGGAGDVPTMDIMARQIRVTGITVGTQRQMRDMIAAIETTAVRPVIDRSFALAELPEAFRYQESGKHVGKIVVEW